MPHPACLTTRVLKTRWRPKDWRPHRVSDQSGSSPDLNSLHGLKVLGSSADVRSEHFYYVSSRWKNNNFIIHTMKQVWQELSSEDAGFVIYPCDDTNTCTYFHLEQNVLLLWTEHWAIIWAAFISPCAKFHVKLKPLLDDTNGMPYDCASRVCLWVCGLHSQAWARGLTVRTPTCGQWGTSCSISETSTQCSPHMRTFSGNMYVFSH